MNRLFTFICILFCTTVLWSQDIPQELLRAFTKADVSVIEKYMESEVNILLVGKSTIFKKEDAANALRNFLKQNRMNNFTVNHKGKKTNSCFVVGTMATVKGIFRINCFMKRNQDTYLIHQIRIDKSYE